MISLVVIPALILGGIVLSLWLSRRRRAALIVCVVIAAGLSFLLRPVCVPISEESLANFNSPIEQRTDRDFYVRVFQQRGGQWHQCKTYISRLFFF